MGHIPYLSAIRVSPLYLHFLNASTPPFVMLGKRSSRSHRRLPSTRPQNSLRPGLTKNRTYDQITRVRHEGSVRAGSGVAAKVPIPNQGSPLAHVYLLWLPIAALRLAALRCSVILIREIRSRKSCSYPAAECQYSTNLICFMMPSNSDFSAALRHFAKISASAFL